MRAADAFVERKQAPGGFKLRFGDVVPAMEAPVEVFFCVFFDADFVMGGKIQEPHHFGVAPCVAEHFDQME